MSDFYIDFLINEILGISFNKIFCLKITIIKKLLQIITHSHIIYIKKILVYRKSTMVIIFYCYVINLYKYLKVYLVTWT